MAWWDHPGIWATKNDATFQAALGNASTGGLPVFVNSADKLGVLLSSRRFKNNIVDLGDESSALLRLRPVSFTYRTKVGAAPPARQFGLIAEEVQEVLPDLVAHDQDGQPLSVYYQFLAPLLLSEAQKQHAVIEQQKTRIQQLEERLQRLEALLETRAHR